MARETAYKSPDFTSVESPLVPSSGGTHPQAAVAWEELQSGLETTASQSDIDAAVADLFFDVNLVGGITEQRPAMEGSAEYFFTRFEVDMIALAGEKWRTRRITDDDLLDQAGHSVSPFYDFKITGEGTFTIEFQSASSNPVIRDGELTLVAQRRPTRTQLSRILDRNESYVFSNGSRIVVNDDWTISPFRANGSAKDQQGIFVDRPATKVRPDGFIALLADGSFLGFPNGSYIRYSITESQNGQTISVPVLSSLAEYNSF